MNAAFKRSSTFAACLLVGLLIFAVGAWGVLALAVSGPQSAALRALLAAAFGAAALAALIALARPRRRWPVLLLFLLLFGAALAWYFSLRPSNDRDWVTENAVLPTATVDGNIVTVHNIRNFAYRTETDFTPAYYDKRFDLGQLEGVDLVATYWMGPHIAHVFLSFAFAGGEHLAISIEARKEKGEGYSTINGFFRQYELLYVVADERDLIGLRTNYRNDPPEQVYVYRLKGNPEAERRVLLEYIDKINGLATRPEFYNSLMTNCTTNIWLNAKVNPDHLPFSWKILASGHVPALLYEHGRLDAQGLPLAELQRRSFVNPRARTAGIDADFSRRIRAVDPAGALK
jgi:hypothetical protein